jgi:hypothetical protein
VGTGSIAPTHSRPRHQMGVSGQRHAPAVLYPGTHWTGGCMGPRASIDTGNRGRILCPCWGLNPARP